MNLHEFICIHGWISSQVELKDVKKNEARNQIWKKKKQFFLPLVQYIFPKILNIFFLFLLDLENILSILLMVDYFGFGRLR